MKNSLAFLALLLAAGCASDGMRGNEYASGGSVVNPNRTEEAAPPLDPKRKINEQDCSRPVEIAGGNLKCMDLAAAERDRRRRAEEERLARLEAERRAKLEAEARAAKARAEAEERARLERERAEQLAREEAARRAKLAEDERLAAEARARAERERLEREAAEAAARERAAREAAEAAERERQRLEQDWLAGRALLERFMTNYGSMDRFKDVATPIGGFLEKTK